MGWVAAARAAATGPGSLTLCRIRVASAPICATASTTITITCIGTNPATAAASIIHGGSRDVNRLSDTAIPRGYIGWQDPR